MFSCIRSPSVGAQVVKPMLQRRLRAKKRLFVNIRLPEDHPSKAPTGTEGNSSSLGGIGILLTDVLLLSTAEAIPSAAAASAMRGTLACPPRRRHRTFADLIKGKSSDLLWTKGFSLDPDRFFLTDPSRNLTVVAIRSSQGSSVPTTGLPSLLGDAISSQQQESTAYLLYAAHSMEMDIPGIPYAGLVARGILTAGGPSYFQTSDEVAADLTEGSLFLGFNRHGDMTFVASTPVRGSGSPAKLPVVNIVDIQQWVMNENSPLLNLSFQQAPKPGAGSQLPRLVKQGSRVMPLDTVPEASTAEGIPLEEQTITGEDANQQVSAHSEIEAHGGAEEGDLSNTVPRIVEVDASVLVNKDGSLPAVNPGTSDTGRKGEAEDRAEGHALQSVPAEDTMQSSEHPSKDEGVKEDKPQVLSPEEVKKRIQGYGNTSSITKFFVPPKSQIKGSSSSSSGPGTRVPSADNTVNAQGKNQEERSPNSELLQVPPPDHAEPQVPHHHLHLNAAGVAGQGESGTSTADGSASAATATTLLQDVQGHGPQMSNGPQAHSEVLPPEKVKERIQGYGNTSSITKHLVGPSFKRSSAAPGTNTSASRSSTTQGQEHSHAGAHADAAYQNHRPTVGTPLLLLASAFSSFGASVLKTNSQAPDGVEPFPERPSSEGHNQREVLADTPKKNEEQSLDGAEADKKGNKEMFSGPNTSENVGSPLTIPPASLEPIAGDQEKVANKPAAGQESSPAAAQAAIGLPASKAPAHVVDVGLLKEEFDKRREIWRQRSSESNKSTEDEDRDWGQKAVLRKPVTKDSTMISGELPVALEQGRSFKDSPESSDAWQKVLPALEDAVIRRRLLHRISAGEIGEAEPRQLSLGRLTPVLSPISSGGDEEFRDYMAIEQGSDRLPKRTGSNASAAAAVAAAEAAGAAKAAATAAGAAHALVLSVKRGVDEMAADLSEEDEEELLEIDGTEDNALQQKNGEETKGKYVEPGDETSELLMGFVTPSTKGHLNEISTPVLKTDEVMTQSPAYQGVSSLILAATGINKASGRKGTPYPSISAYPRSLHSTSTSAMYRMTDRLERYTQATGFLTLEQEAEWLWRGSCTVQLQEQRGLPGRLRHRPLAAVSPPSTCPPEPTASSGSAAQHCPPLRNPQHSSRALPATSITPARSDSRVTATQQVSSQEPPGHCQSSLKACRASDTQRTSGHRIPKERESVSVGGPAVVPRPSGDILLPVQASLSSPVFHFLQSNAQVSPRAGPRLHHPVWS